MAANTTAAPVQGYLIKQGKIMSSWKRRFFKLQGNKLYYFKSLATVSDKALGYVPLEKSTLVQAYASPNAGLGPQPPKDPKCRFSINSPGRTFYLVAESEAEMQSWVQKLNQTLSTLFGGPTPAPSSPAVPAQNAATNAAGTPTSQAPTATALSPRGAEKRGQLVTSSELSTSVPNLTTALSSPTLPTTASSAFDDLKAQLLQETSKLNQLINELAVAGGPDAKGTCELLKSKTAEIENVVREFQNPAAATTRVVIEEPRPLPVRAHTQQQKQVEPQPQLQPQQTQVTIEAKPASAQQQQQQQQQVTKNPEEEEMVEPVRRLGKGKKQTNDRKRIGNDLFSGPNPDLKRISARVLYQRERIEQEILESERSYAGGLTTCIENFLVPLREARERENISPEHINKVFTNIEAVLQVSNALIEHLTEARDSRKKTVGDVFVENAAALKPVYTEYVANYNEAISLLERLQQEATPFSKLLKDLQQASMQASGLSLESYLIMPVQRCPRYVMLLQELMKNTPVVHDDWDSIRLASVKIKEIADGVNTAKTGREHLEKVIAIQKKLTGDFLNLADPNRKFVREGFLRKLWDSPPSATNEQQVQETYFFLFNDLLVYATPHKSQSFFSNILAAVDQLQLQTQLQNESFHFEGFFLLENCKLRDIPDTEELKHAFALVYPKDDGKFSRKEKSSTTPAEVSEVVISLGAYSAESKKKWMGDLEELLRLQQEGVKKSIESDASTECVKAGWLSKRGGKLKIVKRRWFRLQGHTLFYFPNEKTLTPLGSCNLLEFSIIPDKQEQKKNLACFRLYHPTKRNFWLYATTHADMLEWIAAMKPLVLSVSEQFDVANLPSSSSSSSTGLGVVGAPVSTAAVAGAVETQTQTQTSSPSP